MRAPHFYPDFALRCMLEELRLSLWAQQPRRRIRVSLKRIAKYWEEVAVARSNVKV